MIRVGIVGGTGYTGVELMRLLAQHPDAEMVAITSRKEAGSAVADLFPSLRNRVGNKFLAPDNDVLSTCDIIFFATPSGVAMKEVRYLLERGVRAIDLSADFRIKDQAIWEKWYGMTHAAPELLEEAVYGLPELNRASIRTARLVANPGCYPTAVQLGFLPVVAAQVGNMDGLIADAKSGVSGAGRKAELPTSFSEASDNFKAYAVQGHRHLPEIAQGLSVAAGRPITLTFVPHLTPMIRGIHATLYVSGVNDIDVQQLYEVHYVNEPFVDVLPAGTHPDTRSVRGANVCRIAVHRPQQSDTIVVLSVIDNLVKGASGQAIQNMNIMFGLFETTGLDQTALSP